MIKTAFFAIFLGLAAIDAAAKDADPELLQALKAAVSGADSFADRFEAEVWLMAKSQPLALYVEDPAYRLQMLKAIHREATRAELRPEIVLAVIQIESAFNPYAVSRVGAQGIMQVMPFWKQELGRPQDNLIDLNTNLRYGCTILQHYLKKTNGNLADALAYYNGSFGSNKYSRKVLNAWAERWR